MRKRFSGEDLNNITVEHEVERAFAFEVHHKCACMIDCSIEEYCLLLRRTGQKLLPHLAKDSGMVSLVQVGSKRSLEQLHFVCSLANFTWLDLATKVQEERARNRQCNAGSKVELGHFRPILHDVTALERCRQSIRQFWWSKKWK